MILTVAAKALRCTFTFGFKTLTVTFEASTLFAIARNKRLRPLASSVMDSWRIINDTWGWRLLVALHAQVVFFVFRAIAFGGLTQHRRWLFIDAVDGGASLDFYLTYCATFFQKFDWAHALRRLQLKFFRWFLLTLLRPYHNFGVTLAGWHNFTGYPLIWLLVFEVFFELILSKLAPTVLSFEDKGFRVIVHVVIIIIVFLWVVDCRELDLICGGAVITLNHILFVAGDAQATRSECVELILTFTVRSLTFCSGCSSTHPLVLMFILGVWWGEICSVVNLRMLSL